MPNAGYKEASNFLTAGFGDAVGYGLGAAAGQVAGNALGGGGVNFRGKYARNKLKHDQKIWDAQQEHHLSTIRPNQAELMKSLDESGLHRLSALGITPSSGPQSAGSQPMIPGQNVAGSAVETGINTALNVARSDRQAAHQKQYQRLKLQEQSLRNDWLKTQIANSKLKTLAAASNMSQDVPLSSLTGKPHSGKVIAQTLDPYAHTSDSHGYSLFGTSGRAIQQKPGTLRGQALEDAIGEIPAAIVSPLQFMQDIGYTLDNMLLEHHNRRKSNPYKGMGKTGYTK